MMQNNSNNEEKSIDDQKTTSYITSSNLGILGLITGIIGLCSPYLIFLLVTGLSGSAMGWILIIGIILAVFSILVGSIAHWKSKKKMGLICIILGIIATIILLMSYIYVTLGMVA
jgi:hypothetical protein